MNANKLADELDNMLKVVGLTDNRVPIMLRQQQAEIEDLKNANRFIQNFAEEQHKRAVALEMRELTDEEILAVFVENYGDDILPNIQASGIEFARATLRKAQEK